MFFKRLALTIAYVTSIPVGVDFGREEMSSLEGLGKYLPLVGLLIGLLITGLALALAAIRADGLLAATIVTLAWLAITGSLHMDGLMDTADGVFSHQSKEKMLEIMQDSRVGNFGVLTGVAAVLIKLASINALVHSQGSLIPALLLIPTCARWTELYAIACMPYARENGKGKVWHDSTKLPGDLVRGALPVAFTTAILISAYSLPVVLVLLSTTICSGILSAHRLNSIVGGQTGDTYGAVVELSEAGGLLFSALILNYLF